jgi:hypothetical protein
VPSKTLSDSDLEKLPTTSSRAENYHFFLDKYRLSGKLEVQSESVTLSVDYLISSTQAGHLPAWVFLLPGIVAGLMSPHPEHHPTANRREGHPAIS